MTSMPTGLRIIIVGAGFCGLTAAIECKKRGMHPILIEAYAGPSSHGDLLDFVTNGGLVFESWDNGKVAQLLNDSGVNNAKTLDYFNAENVLLRQDPWPQSKYSKGVFAGHRGCMHKIIYDYAVEIGVELRFGTRVAQYLDHATERGVVVDTGERIMGDVVLACDGPKSLARSQLLELPESKVNSGYAIFRAFFTVTDEMRDDPLMKEIIDPTEDKTRFWVGRDLHGFIYTWNKGRDCAWVLTHRDDTDIAESWSFPAKREDVLPYLDRAGFPETWRRVVEFTPNDRLLDYKLVWRDPLKTWLSPSKRCAVMGDAAHCHLPTSAQGACQAVEDAAAVAVCLEKAQGDVELALQVFERIRYNRSHVIHQASISTRDIYHQNDWTLEFVKAHPDSLIMPFYPWVVDYNVFETIEANFARLAADVRSGKKGSIEQLALPAGGTYDAMKIVNSKMPDELRLPVGLNALKAAA
ncbi:salicylate hydroxylase [Penicillium longicatenatum]|uniref:salicylate hydroxylase n=1 Tax=Penicillium longicatenatum TaxID=1561947 RepID=UPI002547FB17|nr:salicylate hydroxylase [Penicillium longicatenatum]KAJ5661153.1 salicylate hydroxylase [Penicillium longicatenatum]